MEQLGNDGVITVEEAKGLDTETELVEGMQFDRGYPSLYFITDAQKMTSKLEDCAIFLHVDPSFKARRSWSTVARSLILWSRRRSRLQQPLEHRRVSGLSARAAPACGDPE
ncbi:hypothetical protein SAMN05444370_12619 [Rubrimonas cliftonensis]|uniref:Chaperonin GroEL n=1 Tax=Rubrimonas cliftonensis TaxID=89524 RepID=A0A1H4FPW5_9RHOB|nr:hypothetical protein SAMN05444370_12619 [Rubrimonas cliftonensis]